MTATGKLLQLFCESTVLGTLLRLEPLAHELQRAAVFRNRAHDVLWHPGRNLRLDLERYPDLSSRRDRRGVQRDRRLSRIRGPAALGLVLEREFTQGFPWDGVGVPGCRSRASLELSTLRE